MPSEICKFFVRFLFLLSDNNSKSMSVLQNYVFLGLEHPSGVVSGKTMHGVVVLVVQEEVQVKSINIKWDGTEFVNWYHGVSQTPSNRVTATRNLFEEVQQLWPNSNTGDDVAEQDKPFPPGTYTYNFSWNLPDGLPGSYEERDLQDSRHMTAGSWIPRILDGNPSYIRYSAIANIELIPGEKSELKQLASKQSFFRVIESFDPKIVIQPPHTVKGSKRFLMAGAAMEARLSIANGGVLFPGQRVAMKLHIDNKSKRQVDTINIKVDEHVIFAAQGQTFPRKATVISAEVHEEMALVKGGTTFDKDLMIDTPSELPTTILGGKHIVRRFELVVQLVTRFGTSLTLQAPLHILGWTTQLKDDVHSVV